jgi:catechol 2,3-dioxygenase-like lactoylglutathione lyase family enzyme
VCDQPNEEAQVIDTKTHIAQIGSVILTVADQDEAIEFYTGVLGFEKRSDTPYGNGDRWVEVAPAGGATAIALVPPREGHDTVSGNGTAIALNSDDIDADHAHLLSRGVDADAEIMRAGDPVPPLFSFRDPDGNNFWVVGSA